ncbi:MAG: DUF3418 domain-containing protein, partial [Pseudomonadales bacterium]|nr:DUF3418 domain-containing protein [Pseudomonadales bacterium]
LAEYPRYLNGIIVRIKRLQGNVERDQTHIPELESWWFDYQQRSTQNQEKGTDDPELDHLRWMLEEYRISLFAQEIKTKYPISSKRLEKQWQKVQR